MSLRQTNLARLKNETFDALIIGGGINGAVAAAALAGQGVRVALIDRGDFAGFTSSQSSNLVWGGIKYLESYDFGLVRKLCLSRNRLIRAYPSTVREIRFLTTLKRGFRYSRGFMWAGTWLYWLFGNGFTRPPRRLSRANIAAEEPVIDVTDSIGGFEYSDAYLFDNDARFVFNFVRSALDRGAAAANYVESLGAERDAGGYWVCRARNVEANGGEFGVRARVLINAAGPYVDGLNRLTGEQTEHRHVFSKGIHLIVDRMTPNRRVLAFFASDGRLFFVIPMGMKTCIGTTDTRVERPETEVTDADRDFLLDNINARLRLGAPLTRADIIAERCGVRPLVVSGQGGDERDWMQLSRKHAIDVDTNNRYLSIFGGKLTDCLNVGEEVTRHVAALGIAVPHRGHRWYGEPRDSVRDEFLHQARLMRLDALTAPESSEVLSSRLWRRYGAHALTLLELIREDPAQAEVLIEGTEYLRCELVEAAQREMVVRLEDFLRRRSKIALVERYSVIHSAPGLMEACRILFGEDAERRYAQYFGQECR